jgi:hypothetical protein
MHRVSPTVLSTTLGLHSDDHASKYRIDFGKRTSCDDGAAQESTKYV